MSDSAETNLVRYVATTEIERLSKELKAPEIELLTLINRKVAAAESLESTMEFYFEKTKDLFPCDRVGLAFFEDDAKRVITRWTKTTYNPVLLQKDYHEGVSGSTLKDVIDARQVRIIDDLPLYLDKKPGSRSTRLLVEEGVKSSMTCPLLVENRVIGLLFRSSRQIGAYHDYEAMLHTQLAERLSQAVEKVYRIEQLGAANRAYMEMLSFASHELKSPLGSIILEANALYDGLYGGLQAQQQEHVQAIASKARQLISLTQEYLDLARVEGGQLKLTLRQNVNLEKDVISSVLDTLLPQSESKKSKISVEIAPEVRAVQCDPILLRTVFLNLIGNAIKYGSQGAEIRVRAVPKDKLVQVSVFNTGTGFPEEQTSKLFKRFSRLAVPEFERIKGTGVGLYIVWQIVQLHAGRIYAKSKYGSWAEFVVEIPLEKG